MLDLEAVTKCGKQADKLMVSEDREIVQYQALIKDVSIGSSSRSQPRV
jgi:hypothetical protein